MRPGTLHAIITPGVRILNFEEKKNICQLYNHLRIELRQSIAQYCNMTLDVLLRGDERLSTNIN